MKLLRLLFLITLPLASGSCYHPLRDETIRPGPIRRAEGKGVRATFLGNTTVLVSDGDTHLLVDGFLSRPGKFASLVGRIEPDREVIANELNRAKITNLHAILVGHAHYDHALDAPFVARLTGATVVGSESYRFVHQGGGGPMDRTRLITLKKPREGHRFGRFTVTMVAAEHVASFSVVQCAAEGNITAPVHTPCRYHEFKCGQVYAIHIAHPDGNIAVTTSAGARDNQFAGLPADVVFLGVGLVTKAHKNDRDHYWRECVTRPAPHTVIPIHWDDFCRPLSRGIAPMPWIADHVRKSMQWVTENGAGRTIRVMNQHESILLRRGKIQW